MERDAANAGCIGPHASTEDGGLDMNEKDCAFAADVLVKLQRACGRTPGDALHSIVQFNSLVLRIASLLPGNGVSGLGDGQRAIITTTIETLERDARRALQMPLGRLTPPLIDLLRCLAKDTPAREEEMNYMPVKNFLPGKVRTHSYITYRDSHGYSDGLCRAEQFYETCVAGLHRLRAISGSASETFYEQLDGGLDCVTYSCLMWGVAVLFDGLRLRRGLEIAAPCGNLVNGQRAPFGLESTASTLLSDGEALVDRERVGRAAQFLLGAANCAVRDYDDPVDYGRCGQGRGEPDNPAYHLHSTERLIKEALANCRKQNEQRNMAPGKSMRLILDAIAYDAEYSMVSPGQRLAFQLAFTYPCLVPKNLRPLEGYDGGLLSVWDACNYLMKLHAQEFQEVLSLQSLLCAVLGGVVGGLVSSTITGPFAIHPESDVLAEVERIASTWPETSCTVPTGKRCESPRGKQVSATTAICDAIEFQAYKSEHKATPLSEARFDGALVMLSIAHNLSQGPGIFDGKPTDGIVALKRLYFSALHAEPGTPEGGGKSKRTSAFTDMASGTLPGVIPLDAIETPWREVVGGALVGTGPLFCFSRKAFEDSLLLDWKPREAVARALELRELCGNERPGAVMLPSTAMELMGNRARRHVADVVGGVDNMVKSVDGPPFVTRVVETLNTWANIVYCSSNFNPLWESSISHFCSPVASNKRQRTSPDLQGPPHSPV